MGDRYNSGVVLLKPSTEMYADAILAARRIEPSKAKRATALLNLARKRQYRDPITDPMAAATVATTHGDQEFLVSFFEYSHRDRWGPLHALPLRYNVRHHNLHALWKLQRDVKSNPGAFDWFTKNRDALNSEPKADGDHKEHRPEKDFIG